MWLGCGEGAERECAGVAADPRKLSVLLSLGDDVHEESTQNSWTVSRGECQGHSLGSPRSGKVLVLGLEHLDICTVY